MLNINIYNESCIDCVRNDLEAHSVDCVVTSPPYGGGVHILNQRTYDVHNDHIDIDKYNKMCVDLFNGLDRVLKPNGVVCWNVSYNKQCSDQFILALASIIQQTPFMIADVVTWKKSFATSLAESSNRLTRICEHVYILVRKTDTDTFYCNKPMSSIASDGRPKYKNIFNYIEAKNTDGHTDLNLACFSTEFVVKMLALYCPPGGKVYDPFMGTGTTAKACVNTNRPCVGSEISLKQCEYAKQRIDSLLGRVTIIKPEQTENDKH